MIRLMVDRTKGKWQRQWLISQISTISKQEHVPCPREEERVVMVNGSVQMSGDNGKENVSDNREVTGHGATSVSGVNANDSWYP